MFKERIKTHHSAMSEGKKYSLGLRDVVEILNNSDIREKKNGTIYIHVPFCNKICSFCNMRRSLQKPASNYADLIVREIKEYAKLEYLKTTTFDAVYFGGGTPTTLPKEELCKILDELKASFNFTSDAEFTIETTVTELEDEKIDMLIKHGVNRFSVGVQTFNNIGRRQMGRIGTGEAAYEKLKKLKSYNGVTVSMDLIYNYNGQTIEDLKEDLDKIAELNLDGFSMYSLIDMKETSIDKAQGIQNDEDMFFAIADIMKERGYHFLELTKMVTSDRYRYIINRHNAADTLPLGAGAGGSVNNLAMMNPINMEEYAKSIEDFANRKGMLFVQEYEEMVRFKGDIQTVYLPKNETMYSNKDQYEEFRNQLLENDMITKDGDRYKLTEKGIFWGNTISRELSKMIG